MMWYDVMIYPMEIDEKQHDVLESLRKHYASRSVKEAIFRAADEILKKKPEVQSHA